MQHFTNIKDAGEGLYKLVRSAKELKANPLAHRNLGEGKTMGIIFLNPSLRTRLSTQKAAQNLGMQAIVMNFGSEGWKLEFEDGVVMDGDKAEHIREAAAVMGAYFDIIGIRSFPTLQDREQDYKDQVLQQMLQHAGVPIVSLESATGHPLQALTDLMTIEELRTVERPKVVLTWAPHPRALPQAVPNSFAECMKMADVDLVITHPEGYELAPDIREGVAVEYDQAKAFEGADFIYAKNWSSYEKYGQILTKDPAWMVDGRKMALTNQAKFLHCLPVRRNVVVADEVLDSPQSVVIQQAGNREFAAQAVLKKMLELAG